MALKGRVIRNQILKKLMPLLWFGLVDRAISLLDEIFTPKEAGVFGEIYIRTPYMSAGYYNDRIFNKKVLKSFI